MNEEPKIIVVGNIYDEKDEFLSAGRVYSGGGNCSITRSSQVCFGKTNHRDNQD